MCPDDDDELLGDLRGARRDQRRQLLAELSANGFTRDELARAIDEDRLALLGVDRVLGGHLTAAEIEAGGGPSAALMTRLRRLQGLPEPALDERAFSAEDVAAARATQLLLDAGFTDEAIVEIAAVLGEGVSRLAATITALFIQTFLRKGDSEEEVSRRFADLAAELTPSTSPILVAAFNAHLRDAVARGVLGQAELATGAVPADRRMAVCFADLVGFTRLGAEVEVLALGTVAGALTRLAAAAAEPPVRLVKTIGDGAMFVCPEVEPLVTAALDFVDAVHAADLPVLRAGIAVGPASQRSGDWYGNSVNVASRVTGVARPGTVLCTQEVRDACPDAFQWSTAGRHRLKGVAEPPVLHRARRRN